MRRADCVIGAAGPVPLLFSDCTPPGSECEDSQTQIKMLSDDRDNSGA